MRRVNDSRRSSLAGNGKIQDVNPVELEGGDGYGVAIELDKAPNGQTSGVRHAARYRRGPRQCTADVLIADARIAGGLVQRDGIDATVAVEISGAQELGRGFGDSGGAALLSGQQREHANGQPNGIANRRGASVALVLMGHQYRVHHVTLTGCSAGSPLHPPG